MYNRSMPVVYETETPLAPRSGLGPYREADYLGLPDEPRCSSSTKLVVTPAPTARHQHVVARVLHLLLDCADRNGDQALASPIDVVLADHSVVQPGRDLRESGASGDRPRADRRRARSRGRGASPGTARRDLGEKLRLYAEAGVAEYWIVDPVNETFEFLVNAGDGFRVSLSDGPIFRLRSPSSSSISKLSGARFRSVDAEVVGRAAIELPI